MAAEAELSVRPTAAEILQRVLSDAESEVGRPTSALAFSGLAAGLTMGFTGLGVAASFHAFGHGPWQDYAAYLIYPIGFVAVIVGRAQLYTENTLYPVALVLDRRAYLRRTLLLWTVVFWSNIAGVLVFAALVTKTHALPHGVQDELAALGVQAVSHTFAYAFWSGIVGGWLIALVAWLVEGTDGGVSMIVVIWILTFVVGVAGLAHCIASSAEIVSAVLAGRAALGDYAVWLTGATIGNTVGGVVIVALLNYGQVMAGGKEAAE
jgi:formate/nitrite transporter FocA (FNT family)